MCVCVVAREPRSASRGKEFPCSLGVTGEAVLRSAKHARSKPLQDDTTMGPPQAMISELVSSLSSSIRTSASCESTRKAQSAACEPMPIAESADQGHEIFMSVRITQGVQTLPSKPHVVASLIGDVVKSQDAICIRNGQTEGRMPEQCTRKLHVPGWSEWCGMAVQMDLRNRFPWPVPGQADTFSAQRQFGIEVLG